MIIKKKNPSLCASGNNSATPHAKDRTAHTAGTGPPADTVRTLNGTKSLVYLL